MTDESSTKLPLTLNPPPPNPPISLILIFGDHTATYPITQHFAQKIGYVHLDLFSRLSQLHLSQNKNKEKLGLLHPLALASGRPVPRALILPILKEWIDEGVEKGSRKFVVTGLEGDGVGIKGVMETVVDPEALIWFYQPNDYFDQNRRNIEYSFGRRAIMVQFVGDLKKAYEGLLGELYSRVRDEDVEMKDFSPVERVDSRLDMAGAVNAALRTRL